MSFHFLMMFHFYFLFGVNHLSHHYQELLVHQTLFCLFLLGNEIYPLSHYLSCFLSFLHVMCYSLSFCSWIILFFFFWPIQYIYSHNKPGKTYGMENPIADQTRKESIIQEQNERLTHNMKKIKKTIKVVG